MTEPDSSAEDAAREERMRLIGIALSVEDSDEARAAMDELLWSQRL